MPNAGWPRSRNQTRLGMSGGVSRRHRRLSSLLGSSTTTAALLVADVVEVGAQHRRGLARALPADQQRAVLAVVGVDQPGAVGGAQHGQQRVGERAVATSALALASGRRRAHAATSMRASRPARAAGTRDGVVGVGAQDLGRHRDARDRDAADGDALHARGRQREQVRGLGGGDQRARGGEQRRRGGGEAAAVEVLADEHPAAVQAVLAAAGLDGGGELAAGLAVVGGDDELEPEQAAVLGAFGVGHLGAVERRGQAALGQSPALRRDEPVLVAAVEPAGERLEAGRRGGEAEADRGGDAERDLGVRDRLQRRRGELVAGGAAAGR